MTFAERAEPMIQLGIPCIPVLPRDKRCILEGWESRATTDKNVIAAWNRENPDYNVGLVAKGEPGCVCFLEFDVKGGMKEAAKEMGQEVPKTRVHKSGSGYGHWLFKHTERSAKLGNRQAKRLDGQGEWFSFRANDRYVVGPGSVHPNGSLYQTAQEKEIIPVPDWLCDWVGKHTQSARSRVANARHDAAVVSDDFDLDDLFSHYSSIFSIRHVKDDVWYVPDICPIAGHAHEQSTLTGFYYDGSALGWNCFASGCDSCGKSIGWIIKRLNDMMIDAGGEAYAGPIWEPDHEGFEVEMVHEDEEPAERVCDFCHRTKSKGCICRFQDANDSEYRREMADVATYNAEARKQALVADEEEAIHVEDEAPPKPESPEDVIAFLNQKPPEEIMVDPYVDEGCLYGWIGEKTKTIDAPLDFALLALTVMMAGQKVINGTPGNVRGNLYGCMIAPKGKGKTRSATNVRDSVYHAEKFGNPASDHGLIEMLGGKYLKDDDDIDKTPKPYFLVIDEYLNVFAKMGIENSGLPYTFNQLFNFDEIEKSTRKCHIIAFPRLSVLGGLTCDDPVEFAKVFGRQTVTGFYDRHLYALCQPDYEWNDEWEATPEHRAPGGVRIPSEMFKLKKEWVAKNRDERDRLGELALRVATVWTAYNHDQVMTMECFQAALRWMEKQEVIRRRFRPGLAETPQGTASEAILNVFRNRRNPDGTYQWTKWRGAYRKYHWERYGSGVVAQIKKSLVQDHLLETQKDEQTGKPTGFYRFDPR